MLPAHIVWHGWTVRYAIHVPEEDVVAVGVWLASSSLETVPWQPPHAHELGQYPMLLHHSGRGAGKEGGKEEVRRAT